MNICINCKYCIYKKSCLSIYIKKAFNDLTFPDGTPFGIKEE